MTVCIVALRVGVLLNVVGYMCSDVDGESCQLVTALLCKGNFNVIRDIVDALHKCMILTYFT